MWEETCAMVHSTSSNAICNGNLRDLLGGKTFDIGEELLLTLATVAGWLLKTDQNRRQSGIHGDCAPFPSRLPSRGF
jgi:hypothetical protein